MNERRLEERTQWVYDDKAFPVWNASFDRSVRTDMIKDDLWAGRSIALLLSALVTIGVILALGIWHAYADHQALHAIINMINQTAKQQTTPAK